MMKIGVFWVADHITRYVVTREIYREKRAAVVLENRLAHRQMGGWYPAGWAPLADLQKCATHGLTLAWLPVFGVKRQARLTGAMVARVLVQLDAYFEAGGVFRQSYLGRAKVDEGQEVHP